MPTYPAEELTPIMPGKPADQEGGAGAAAPEGVEVWPQGAEKPQKGKPDKGMPQPGKPKPGEEGAEKGKGEGDETKDPDRRTTTDTEKVIGESDATARGTIKRIYEESKRRAAKSLGKAGKEAGSSLGVFQPLLQAKIDWPKLLKQKVRFFADKVGRKLKQQPSYLMYPYKAQAQVGIVSKAPLRKPEKNFIYMIFAFDTSGSITSDEMQSIVDELNAVANVFKKGTQGVSGKVFAMEWDTSVHQFEEFKPSKTIQVKGGGGTDPTAIFKYIDNKVNKKLSKEGKYYALDLGGQDQQMVRPIPGTKYTSAPFLVIFTDGMFSNLSKGDLGEVYGMSEDNIFWILTQESDSIYPKKEGNWILYDKPQF